MEPGLSFEREGIAADAQRAATLGWYAVSTAQFLSKVKVVEQS
jgi:hypothetical protein